MKRYNLKFFRQKMNLTQQQMAERLGISKTYYVQIELGTADPSFKICERFAEVFEYDDIWTLLKKGA